MLYKVVYINGSKILGSVQTSTGGENPTGYGDDVWAALRQAVGNRGTELLRTMSGNAELRWSEYLPRYLPTRDKLVTVSAPRVQTTTKGNPKIVARKGIIPSNFRNSRSSYDVCGVYTNDANKTLVFEVYSSPERAVLDLLPYIPQPEPIQSHESTGAGESVPRTESNEPLSTNRDTPAKPDFATIAKSSKRSSRKKGAQVEVDKLHKPKGKQFHKHR